MKLVNIMLKSTAIAAVLIVATVGCATNGAHGTKDRGAAKSEETDTTAEPNANTLYAMARMMRAQGKANEEETVLRRILDKEPKYLPAYVDLAELLVRQKRTDEATRLLAQGLETVPNDPVLLNDLGMCFVLQDKPADALPHFQAAASAAPREPRYRANVALALGLLGRYEESLNAYREILPDADAQYNIAVIIRMNDGTSSQPAAADAVEELKAPIPPVAATPLSEPVPAP